ncbi:hypothetical protein LSAT2_018477 [Lamellibrachia satsuma]|nr:hypothetical protein LSAT2_018477 [Lamellibrachia satsuma]
MADLEAVLADVSYLMAMEKSKSAPAARASKKIVLPDPSVRSIMHKHLEKMGEVTFDNIFNQKLGYLIFKDFCENVCDEPVHQLKFYEEIKKFDSLETDEERIRAGKEIYDQFIMKELLSQSHMYSKEAVDHVQEALTKSQKDGHLPNNIFEPYITEIKKTLRGPLFKKFLASEKYTSGAVDTLLSLYSSHRAVDNLLSLYSSHRAVDNLLSLYSSHRAVDNLLSLYSSHRAVDNLLSLYSSHRAVDNLLSLYSSHRAVDNLLSLYSSHRAVDNLLSLYSSHRAVDNLLSLYSSHRAVDNLLSLYSSHRAVDNLLSLYSSYKAVDNLLSLCGSHKAVDNLLSLCGSHGAVDTVL